ncbi:MAG: hypothetical protein ACREFB_18370, partial [Stellaceae bacterium]
MLDDPLRAEMLAAGFFDYGYDQDLLNAGVYDCNPYIDDYDPAADEPSCHPSGSADDRGTDGDTASASSRDAPTLAHAPRILDRMADELERTGLVGERRAAKLCYLILTSRFLARPLCAVIRGQSSAGKSYTVERVKALFPPSAYYFLTGASERALAYGTEPLVHRILVVAEAAASGSDGSIDAEQLDPAPWHALQIWLENGVREVVVPFAARLAKAIPPVATRLRRIADADQGARAVTSSAAEPGPAR